MTTPITGAISLADIRTELGLSGAISLGDTKVKNLLNQNTDLNSGHAAKYIGSSTTNVNLFSTMGSPGTATTYKAYIDSGVTIGGTSGSTALTVGQFPSGSSVIINNYGSIQGYGGSGGGYYSSGGAGGDAINANYANQSVTINNQSGATIYGGGGGGGSGGLGGSGGSGGAGGGGYYVQGAWNYQYDGSNYYVQNQSICYCGSRCDYVVGVWGFVLVLYEHTWYTTGQIWYQPGTTYPGYYIVGSTVCNTDYTFSIGKYYEYNVYTSGGSGGPGGAGGAGGAGGQGQGYGQSNTSGSGGAGGSPGGGGSGGGTNAGAGGSGGYGGSGGTGGAGGTWGNAGSAGSTGNSGATGNTGASGNNGGGAGGSAGSGGGAGASGGAAGRYLVKGSNSVTLNNSGTVLGGLA